ncbi:NAC domain-containing protein [Forsythia ovata]|uniref:NAC domain-containing protein n=1 Tax=Forsythia ovata TaxID=205694 RepID=A0ABD1T903_9LAMI
MMPLGYRFEPTDEELIHCYLEKKVKGLPLPWNVSIVERDLYGENANPWNVLSDNDPWDNYSITWDRDRMKSTVKKKLYVFTNLSKISKKRTERRAGCGTWNGQTSGKSIKNSNGEIIGSGKMLSFEVKVDSDEIKKIYAHWLMHEYSLAGVSLEEHTSKDYVICKITKILKLPKKDRPVVGFTYQTGYEIIEELGKKRSTTMEDCPHGNRKQKKKSIFLEGF